MLLNQQYTDTITDLRALRPGGVHSLNVLGYYKPGDGGGGQFYWDAWSNEPDDGGTCIVPEDNPRLGRWKRIWGDRISVKAFGAVGDGSLMSLKELFSTLLSAQAVYRHATSLDNTLDWVAIQAALNQLNQGMAKGNHSLVIPAGNYRISETLQVPNSASYWSLVGAGKLSTQLRWHGPISIPILQLTNVRSAVIRDLGFYGNGTAPPSHGILVHRGPGKIDDAAPQDVTYERILIANHQGESFDIGIGYTAEENYYSNNEQGHFIDVDIHNANRYGLSFEHSNSLLHRIYGGRIEGAQAAINNVGPNNTQGGCFQVFGASLGLGSNPAPDSHVLRLGTARYPIQIYGAAVESRGGLLTTPITVKEKTIIQFMGGAFHIGDTNYPSVIFNATENALLEMVGVFISNAHGVTWSFPRSGSTVLLRDMRMVTKRIAYNNQVVIEQTWNGAGDESFELINEGDGELKIIDGKGSLDNPRARRFDLMASRQSDDTVPDNQVMPSVQGWDYYEAAYAEPVIIYNFLDGFPGKSFSYVVHNTNITIQQYAKICLKGQQDLQLPAKTHIRFQQAFNRVWIQAD